MATGRVGLVLAAVAVGISAGCVDRRFVVETNVPGAQVYVDGQPIGPSPADGWWEYAGYREFTAVAPGYEPLHQKVRFRPKWYQYPPIDLIAEAFWPFRIEDVRRVRLELEPLRPVNQLDLLGAADALRARGMSLPPSSIPEQPRRQAVAPAAPPLGSTPGSYLPLPIPQNMAPRPIVTVPSWNQLPPVAAPPVPTGQGTFIPPAPGGGAGAVPPAR